MNHENKREKVNPIIIIAAVFLSIVYIIAAIDGFKAGWNFAAMILN